MIKNNFEDVPNKFGLKREKNRKDDSNKKSDINPSKRLKV